MYYYHPDHLGSSSYITDKEGQVIQHTEYIAFGEVLVDEHSTTNKMPYLFNGKELDYETGLYYYGARYYDPKTSIFLNVDPLVEKTGTPYAYTYNNPIRYIDPTGMKGEDWYQDKYGQYVYDDTIKSQKDLNDKGIKGQYIGEHFQRGHITYAADGYIYDDSTQGRGLPIENGRINNIEEVVITKNTTIEKIVKSIVVGINMYNGFNEVRAGAGLFMLPEPTTITKVSGAYLMGDGAVRLLSGLPQLYGIWNNNKQLENLPGNLLGLGGNIIDNITNSQTGYTTGGNAQLIGEMLGDFGLARRSLYQAIISPTGKSKMNDYIRAGKIINSIFSPARTSYSKGQKLKNNEK